MEIIYIGHASFRMKGKTASVVTDPYDPNMVGLKYPKISADIVTISHQHSDHNFLQGVKDVKKVISGPGEYEVSGVSIIGIASYHDKKKGAERGKNTIYVFEIDGLRIVHLGDLGHKLTEDELEEIGTVDILMVPVGGFYTIDYATAAEIVRGIEPYIVIPMHYKVQELKQAFEKLTPLDDFLKEVALPVESLEKLSIKKGEIEEESKVIVLKRKS